MNNDQVSAMLIADGFSLEAVKKILELRKEHDCLMEKTREEIIRLQRKAILFGYNFGEAKIFCGCRAEIDKEKGQLNQFPVYIKKEIKK